MQRAGGGYGGEYGGGDGRGGGGGGYQSKLDDFEAFVRRAKFPALSLAPAAASTQTASAAAGGSQGTPAARVAVPARPKLLLLEDLPHTHDMERRQRLAAALRDLAACARGPIVLIATEVEGGASGSGPGGGGGGGGGGDGGSMGGARGLHKVSRPRCRVVSGVLRRLSCLSGEPVADTHGHGVRGWPGRMESAPDSVCFAPFEPPTSL